MADATAGRRAALVAGELGLVPALGIGVFRFAGQEPPEVREQLLGSLTFILVLAAPYLVALAVSRVRIPEFRGAVLLAMGILSLAPFFLVPSPVMVLLLPAGVALVIAAVRGLGGTGRRVILAFLFLIPGLAVASAIGFSFYALFQV